MEYNVWTIVVGLSGAFGLGMCFSLLGSIAVKLMPRLEIDEGKFGSMISAFMFSCLVFSLIVGVVMDSVGFGAVAVFGFIAASACIFLLANAKGNQAGIIACVLLGAGAMACSTVGNVLGTSVLADKLGGDYSAANNLVNVFFGLGLFITPLLVSFLFQKTSYEKSVSALAVVILLPVVFAFMAKYPEADPGFVVGDALALLAQPITWIAAAVLFCYIALEASFSNWLAPFGKEVISKESPDMDTGKVDASAARLLSAFAISMMVGRLIAGFSGITAAGGYLIAGGAVVSILVIMSMTKATSGKTAYIMASIAGLVFGPLFPTTVGVTFGKMGASGSLMGIIFAIGLVGAITVPKAIGNMASGKSVQHSLKLLLPPCVALVVLAIVLQVVPAPEEAIIEHEAPESTELLEDV